MRLRATDKLFKSTKLAEQDDAHQKGNRPGKHKQNPKQYLTQQIGSFTSNLTAPTSGAAGDEWDGTAGGLYTSDQRLVTRIGDGSTNWLSTSLHTGYQQSVNGVTVMYAGTSGAEPAVVWITDLANAYGVAVTTDMVMQAAAELLQRRSPNAHRPNQAGTTAARSKPEAQ